MNILEKLLVRFSRDPIKVKSMISTHPDSSPQAIDERLNALLQDFGIPFLDTVRGRNALDLGCGRGLDGRALAKAGAHFVVGIDYREILLPRNNNQMDLEFLCGDARTIPFHDQTFDIILLKDSMEHVSNPARVLLECRRILTPGGYVFITFGPLWLSPYGAHLRRITPIPWVHLLFPEKTLMAVRSNYYEDGATRFEEVSGGLNRMTLRKFFGVINDSGLKPTKIELYPVKKMVPLTFIPGLRELFTNKVVCILQKA